MPSKYIGKHAAPKPKKKTQPAKSTNKKASSAKIKKTPVKKQTKAVLKTKEKAASNISLADMTNFISKYAVHFSVGILAVFVAITTVYGLKGYRQAQLDNYKLSIYEINVSTEEHIITTNNLYSSFVGTFVSEDTISTDFKAAADSTRRASLALDTLNPPEKYQSKHSKMKKLYSNAAKVYLAIAKVTDNIVDRNRRLQKFSANAQSFGAKIASTYRRREARELASQAKTSLTASLKGLGSNKVSTDFIAAMTVKLDDLDKALQSGSRFKMKTLLNDINVEYANKWEKVFLNNDNKVFAAFTPKINQIKVLYKQVDN